MEITSRMLIKYINGPGMRLFLHLRYFESWRQEGKERKDPNTDIEVVVGEVEERKNTFGLFGGHSSGITNK